MTNWWQRALGGETPQPPPAPPQPAPAPAYPQPQYRPQQTPQPGYPPQGVPGSKRIVTKENVVDAVNDPSSYEGLVTPSMKQGDTQNCPNCGSHLYFVRSNAGTVVNVNTGQMAHPTALCEACGYPKSHHLNPPGVSA